MIIFREYDKKNINATLTPADEEWKLVYFDNVTMSLYDSKNFKKIKDVKKYFGDYFMIEDYSVRSTYAYNPFRRTHYVLVNMSNSQKRVIEKMNIMMEVV